MRPTIQVLTPNQIEQILADARRILAETGIEVRGAALRQRLLDAGLPLDASGQRVLFPPDVVARPASAARSRSMTGRATPAELTGDRFLCPASTPLPFDHRSSAAAGADADFVDYVRLAGGWSTSYLATAFSTAGAAGDRRCLAALPGADPGAAAGGLRRVHQHGVPRMAECWPSSATG